MTNALATVGDKQLSVDKRVATLRELMLKNAHKIAAAAAGSISPDRLIQMACNSIRKNPALLNCNVPSIFGALSEAAAYGWSVDGVLGHAYLVPFREEATLIPGYKGLRDLIGRAGRVQVSIESVHEGDEYQYRGLFELPLHTYSADPARKFKPTTHAYVVGDFGQGRVRCWSWTAGECLAHRDAFSQSWRRVAKDPAKAKDSPWCETNPSFRVMCMKTVLLDCIHRGEFPLSLDERNLAERAVNEDRREAVVMDVEDFELTEEAAIEQPEPAALEHEMSDTEKARVAVEEALPECKTLAAVNKVLTKYQTVLTAADDKEWLVSRCDARAQELSSGKK